MGGLVFLETFLHADLCTYGGILTGVSQSTKRPCLPTKSILSSNSSLIEPDRYERWSVLQSDSFILIRSLV